MKSIESIRAMVKEILMVSGDEADSQLAVRIKGIMAYMKDAGIAPEKICSENGVLAIAIGVNDTWNTEPGASGYSKGFYDMVTQLQVISMPNSE